MVRCRCSQALGAAKSPELLRRTLDFTMSGEVRTSDVPFPLAAVSSNPAGRDLAWQYLKDQWALFDQKFGGGLFLISTAFFTIIFIITCIIFIMVWTVTNLSHQLPSWASAPRTSRRRRRPRTLR